MSDTADRLHRLVRVAADLDARADLADARAQLDRLREPEKLTTEAGLALAAITAERKAAERAARTAELSAAPSLLAAELTATQRTQ